MAAWGVAGAAGLTYKDSALHLHAIQARIAKHYWIILIVDISLDQSESWHLRQNLKAHSTN